MTTKNKAGLVTGAGIGIGRAIAQSLAAEGAGVVIFDRDLASASETARLIGESGGRCEVFIGDVTSYGDVSAAVRQCAALYGSLDVLVNNAGVCPMNSLADTTLEQFENAMRVNVSGVFHGCKAAAPLMTEQQYGKIVNIASWFGKIGKPNYGAYCASKFAVIGLTQSLAMELARYKVNVNAVCPGTIVETAMRDATDREAIRLGNKTARQREDQIPIGRVGLPGDIARVVSFLVSPSADYMTGQSLNVTGGLLMH